MLYVLNEHTIRTSKDWSLYLQCGGKLMIITPFCQAFLIKGIFWVRVSCPSNIRRAKPSFKIWYKWRLWQKVLPSLLLEGKSSKIETYWPAAYTKMTVLVSCPLSAELYQFPTSQRNYFWLLSGTVVITVSSTLNILVGGNFIYPSVAAKAGDASWNQPTNLYLPNNSPSTSSFSADGV